MFKGTFKDVVTNILALLTVTAGVVKAVIDYSATASLDNWLTYVIGLVVVIVAYFTGKSGDGKAKTE